MQRNVISFLLLPAVALLLALGILVTGLRAEPQIRRWLHERGFVDQLPSGEQFFEHVVLAEKLSLMRSTEGKDVWAFGDSSCLFGFDPISFEEEGGLSAVNLGTFGYLGTEGHAQMFEWMLEMHERPKAVLLWLHPHTLTQSNEAIENAGYQKWLYARYESRGPSRFNFIDPLRRANDLFGETVRLAFLGKAGWDRPKLGEQLIPTEVQERVRRNEGWFPTVPATRRLRNPVVGIHEDSYAGLRRFAKLAEEAAIPLYLFIMPPLDDGAAPTEKFGGIAEKVSQLLDAPVRIQPPDPTVQPTLMQSPTHFARDEARLTSARIARAIADRP